MSTCYCIGSLLAIYYFVGRWTFARLDDGQDLVPMVEQPRFWIVAMLVVAGVALHSGASRQLRQFRFTNVDLAIFGFMAYMLITVIWATDPDLAADKSHELLLMLTVAAVVAVSRQYDDGNALLLGFWTMMVAIGAVFAALALMNPEDGRAVALGGGPNTFGRNMGLAALGALYLGTRYGTAARLASVGIVAISALLIVRCGSRGGLLSFAVAAGVYTVMANTTVVKKAAIISAMTAATSLVFFYTEPGRQAIDVFSGRIIELTIENQHLAGRGDLWTQAIDLFKERPLFGWGLNGFRANSWNYPHNIFLEIATEGGLVGLILILYAAWVWLAKFWRHRYQLPRVSLAAVVLTLTAAQTSGDLFDSRGAFLMMALATPALIVRRTPRALSRVGVMKSSPRRHASVVAID